MGWSSSAAEDEALTGLLDQFNEETGASAEFSPSPDYDPDLQTALAGGQPPDVFYVDSFKLARPGGGRRTGASTGGSNQRSGRHRPVAPGGFHLRRNLLLPAQGLLDLGAAVRPSCTRGGRGRSPNDVGRTACRRRGVDHGRSGRHRQPGGVSTLGSIPLPKRSGPDQRGRHRDDARHAGGPGGARVHRRHVCRRVDGEQHRPRCRLVR